ncbi:MAG: hypothetical protein Q9203_004948 [Teloschistes exilis]
MYATRLPRASADLSGGTGYHEAYTNQRGKAQLRILRRSDGWGGTEQRADSQSLAKRGDVALRDEIMVMRAMTLQSLGNAITRTRRKALRRAKKAKGAEVPLQVTSPSSQEL